MIKSIKLGTEIFPVNLIQAPLAGVSCAPFRVLTHLYSRPAYCCTEMLSCKTLNKPQGQQQRYLQKDAREGKLCFQLSGSNSYEVGEATKRVTDYGADLIDLNCGCPVNKIRKKGAGSALLTTPAKLYDLITQMKRNTSLPVSIKIRVEKPEAEKFHQEIIQAVTDAGLDFLVVHGRHWTHKYNIPCNYSAIKYFVDNLKIPVIGNGDVACPTSLIKMFEAGCDGVMIGRASVGQPWLIKYLIATMRQEIFNKPSLSQVGEIFLEHVYQLIQLLKNENMAILQARNFSKYYARQLSNKEEFCNLINICKSFAELKNITTSYFYT